MSEPNATPAAPEWRAAISRVAPPPALSATGLADLLAAMPNNVAGLPRKQVQAGGDGATVVYVAGEETGQPSFGMVVALIVPPQPVADSVVASLQRERWGDPAEHTVTESSPGDDESPAYRAFWRAFPPGLFALPNQPVYFLIFYRADTEYAFMVIGSTPEIRAELAAALGVAFGT